MSNFTSGRIEYLKEVVSGSTGKTLGVLLIGRPRIKDLKAYIVPSEVWSEIKSELSEGMKIDFEYIVDGHLEITKIKKHVTRAKG